MRTRSMLALFVVVGIVAACGGGGGGGAVESAGRADNVHVTIADCAGTPGIVLNGSFYKVTLARGSDGGLLTPADVLADASGTATLLSNQQAKFTSASGQTTATLTLVDGPLPSC